MAFHRRAAAAERASARPRRGWRTFLAVIATFSMTTATLGVATAAPVAAASDEEATAAAEGLADFIENTLGGLADFAELGQAIPGTDLVPTAPPALDVLDTLAGIAQAVRDVPGKTESTVENELNDNVTSVGAVDVNIDGADIDTSAGTLTIETFELSRNVAAPLAFSTGEPDTADFFSLAGGELVGDIVLDLTSGGPLVFDLVPTGEAGEGSITGLADPVPDAVLSADLEVAGEFETRLGILDVTAGPGGSGPAAASSIEITVTWQDPDGSGAITEDELVHAAPDDLFVTEVTAGAVSLDVALTSDLDGLGEETGTVELNDPDLTNGFQDDSLDFSLGELGNFTNFTPQDVLSSLAQLAIGTRGLQLKLGNLDLPLIDENLAELANWSDRITRMFTENELSDPSNPVDLTITDEDLADADLLTLEGIIAELAAALDVDPSDLGLAYDPDGDAATFTLDLQSDSFLHQAPDASVNVADELAHAGITGLDLTGDAVLDVDPSYSLDLTVGLDLSDAAAAGDGTTTPITDRVFIEIGDGDELSLDVPIAGDLAMVGTIGFLQIQLEDSEDGAVDLLAPVDDSKPMLAVDIAGSSGDRLTLTQLFDATSSVEVTNPNPGEFQLDLGEGRTITATANVGVPQFALDVSTSVEGMPAADGGVSFAWPNLFVGEPQVTTSSTFNDDFLSFNLDSEDPLALFATILDGVEALFGTFQRLDQAETAAGDLLDEELPLTSTSVQDALAFLGTVRDSLNAMASDPSGSLQLLELQASAVIATALDELDPGTDAFDVPDVPDPNDFVSGTGDDEEFDRSAYSAAVGSYVADLEAFVADGADFLDIRYETGNSPGSVILDFDISVCSDQGDHDDCQFEWPITKPFNLDLGGFGGGLIGGETNGEIGVDYGVNVSADFGIDLPTVVPGGDGVPDGEDEPDVSLFVLDTTALTADIAGFTDGQASASIGPFEVQVGDNSDPGIPEDADLECDDAVDNDDDGVVNDGCLQEGKAETGEQCADDEDAKEDEDDGDPDDPDDDIPADGLVNDGCPAVNNPFDARAGVSLSLTNDLGDAEEGDRSSDIAGFFDGLSASADPAAGGTCGDVLVCADLPIYLAVDGEDHPTYLGTIQYEQTDFDSEPDANGAEEVFDNLQAEAPQFLWSLLGEGIREFGAVVERSLDADEYDAEVPVVGDLLDAGAEVGTAFRQGVTDPIGDLVGDLDGLSDFDQVENTIRDHFWDTLSVAGSGLLLNHDEVVDSEGEATNPDKGEDILVTLLCGDDGHVCVAEDDVGDGEDFDEFNDLSDVQVEFKIGQVAVGATPEFDFGVPGLRLSGGGGTVSSSVSWELNVGFGISLDDGFYLLTDTSVDDSDDELTLSATVDLGEPADTGGAEGSPGESLTPALEGDLAFLGVDVHNAKADRLDPHEDDDGDGRAAHEVTIDLTVDIPDPGTDDKRLGLSELVTGFDPTDFEVGLLAGIDVYLTLVTSANFGDQSADGAIPKLLADLSLEWDIDGSPSGGLQYGDLIAEFENVRVDYGSFLGEFLTPVLAEVQRTTEPLQPVIDTLQAPIPGVAELAELVGAEPITLLDLMEQLADSDLTLIRRLLDVVSLAQSIPTSGEVIVPIGEFGLDSGALGKPELPANKKAQLIDTATEQLESAVAGEDGIFGSDEVAGVDEGGDFTANFADATGDDGGFSFPAFENPAQLFQLVVGGNPTLVHFDAGTLRAEVSHSVTFGPIALGPVPVSVVVSIGAAVEGRFAMGYDTAGIRRMVQNLTDDDAGNDGLFENVGVLFAGVFIDDLDAQGNDVPEIRLMLEAAVGAAVDLVIVTAGVEAGVRATLDLNLHDGGFAEPVPPENLDGKLRVDEIIQVIRANPICLFDVSGRLEAFIRLFVKIDFGLFSKTFKQTIVNIVLLELTDITADLCNPPPPVLAEPIGSTLVLNMGERADQRNYDEDNPDEEFTVRQLTEGASGATISVTAYGIVQTFDGIDKVVASGAAGDDKVTTEHGAISGVCQDDEVTVEPDIGLDCEGLPGDDTDDAQPGGTVTKLIPFTVPVSFCGGAGADTLGGGRGNDVLRGDGKLDGTDCVDHDSGDDEDTGDGIDKINGGAGNDEISGGQDDDDLNGDAGDDKIVGGPGGDQITGGPGQDELRGEAGEDLILGGPEADPCPRGDYDEPDRDLCEPDADDVIHGGLDADTIEGDHGKDEILAGPGDDTVIGGFGDDDVRGGVGNDTLFGNEGYDKVRGGSGDDDVHGDDGDDRLFGGPDEDDIVGGLGADEIEGGSGHDVILGDLGTINRSAISGPDGDGFVPADPDLALVDLVDADLSSPDVDAEDLADTISGGGDPDRIWGQEGGDVINGNGGDDVARGNDGDDRISGDQGEDQLHGDLGDDVIHGDDADASHGDDDGVDTIRGGQGDDLIEGNAAGDRLFGDSGDDRVYGDAEDEAPCGRDGDDVIRGGPDDDYLFGNAGADRIFGNGGRDRIVGGSDTFGICDDADTIAGGTAADVIAGDNATIDDAAATDDMLVRTWLDDQGAGDVVNGDGGDAPGADDRIFGQYGEDRLFGDGGRDYIEGNEGIDTISGGVDEDDLIGGSSASHDGGAGDPVAVVDPDRSGEGRQDDGDVIDGDADEDWIAGDNALINRNVDDGRADLELFDVGRIFDGDLDEPDPGTSGVDTIDGGDGPDRIFGQGQGDVIDGGAGDDYVEGNDGDDTISGQAGLDDLIGGGSAYDGVIDDDRNGTNLLDTGETHISGGQGQDWITGDNAIVTRNVPVPDRAPIELFDVENFDGDEVSPLTSGGDFLTGDGGEDRIFGQGNGDQVVADELDPEDGRNNDFIAAGPDAARPDDPGHDDFDRRDGDADEDAAGWSGDIIWGGTGDDEIEGNHGNDLIFGNAPVGEAADPVTDRDDIVGGGSADDGRIFNDARDGVGAGLLDGHDVIHGDEGDATAGDDDVILGDNGWIQRPGAIQSGPGPETHTVDPDGAGPIEVGDPIEVSIPVRTTDTGLDPEPTTFGNDYLAGNGGHDDLVGQAGDDALNGEWGSDGIIGDLGTITVDLLGGDGGECGEPRTVEPREPFITEEVCQPGTLFRRVELLRFDDTEAEVVEGADVILGGDGDDWLHGGPGLDLINGDGDGLGEEVDPDLPDTQRIIDPNPGSADFDRIFGGDSNGAGTVDPDSLGDGDALWGGRGHDHLFGGHGADNHDIRPDPDDPAEPFPETWWAWALADVESYHGVDHIYGGHGPDAMQANVADNGPEHGDRLMDWSGVFNLSLLCPATYGAYVTVRDMSPGLIRYWEEIADTDGVHEVTSDGSSGFRELAMVFKPDVKDNNNPPYPGTPGHFFACD